HAGPEIARPAGSDRSNDGPRHEPQRSEGRAPAEYFKYFLRLSRSRGDFDVARSGRHLRIERLGLHDRFARTVARPGCNGLESLSRPWFGAVQPGNRHYRE